MTVKNMNMTNKIKKKISNTLSGHTVSIETRKKISIKLKGRFKGKDNPFYGKHHSEESRRKISEANKGNKYNNGRKFSEEHKQHLRDSWKTRGPVSEETKRRQSESKKGKKNHRYGKSPPISSSHGKQGYRKDIDLYVRSTWEANFARVLNYHNVKWEYEPKDKRCYFPNSTYKPDFYLPEHDLYIEISAYVDDRKRKNLELREKYYPDLDFIHITEKEWGKYFNSYKEIINKWER